MMPVKACGCGWDCWMEMKLQSLCHVRVLLCEQLLNFENWQPSASANRLRLHPLQKAANNATGLKMITANLHRKKHALFQSELLKSLRVTMLTSRPSVRRTGTV